MFFLLLVCVILHQTTCPPPIPSASPVDLQKDAGIITCGNSIITSEAGYCRGYRNCDKAAFILSAKNLSSDLSFALCPHYSRINKSGGALQIRINSKPDTWKKLKSIYCVEKGSAPALEFLFEGKGLKFNQGANLSEIALRCMIASYSDGQFDELSDLSSKEKEGVYNNATVFMVYSFVALVITLIGMLAYYTVFLAWTNSRLQMQVFRLQLKHDEMELVIDRATRLEFDPEETWSSMPVVHQQVAIEAAIFLQKYKHLRFTPQLRQLIVDRGFPCGATEIILDLAGLGDPEIPFYAPLERMEEAQYQKKPKVEEYAQLTENRIIDTLNYANRLRRRKIVFTDFRWFELHHFFLELFLTTIGSNSHPTMHDAPLPVLPRRAFGTRDEHLEEQREENERLARAQRPHFLHYDWDEARRLLGSEA